MLAAAAGAFIVTHWLRLLPLGYAAPGATRWEDWIDLLTPYAVAGPLLAAMSRAAPSRREWVTALTAAAVFVQGHGVHLSANSIAHAVGDAAPAHLWDEVVGHALWYAGLAVLVGVLARAYARTDLRAGPVAGLLALATGVTWATNAAGAAGLAWPGVAVAAALGGWGLTLGGGAGRLLALAFLPSAAGLALAQLAR